MRRDVWLSVVVNCHAVVDLGTSSLAPVGGFVNSLRIEGWLRSWRRLLGGRRSAP